MLTNLWQVKLAGRPLYDRVKKNQLDAKLNSFQMIVCCPGWTTDSYLKRIISTNCCIHMAVPPDDGPRYARNMYRLTKYTKHKLCIKLVYLYMIISRRRRRREKKHHPRKKKISETFKHMITQQIRQSTYNITLRHVHVSIIAVKKQEVLHNLSVICSLR